MGQSVQVLSTVISYPYLPILRTYTLSILYCTSFTVQFHQTVYISTNCCWNDCVIPYMNMDTYIQTCKLSKEMRKEYAIPGNKIADAHENKWKTYRNTLSDEIFHTQVQFHLSFKTESNFMGACSGSCYYFCLKYHQFDHEQI